MVTNLPANTGDTVLILDPTFLGASKPVCHNYGPCALEELQPLSPPAKPTETHVPHGLCSATRESTAMRSKWTATSSNPCSLQLEESLCSIEDPTRPKIN